jgi:hypothetical protein
MADTRQPLPNAREPQHDHVRFHDGPHYTNHDVATGCQKSAYQCDQDSASVLLLRWPVPKDCGGLGNTQDPDEAGACRYYIKHAPPFVQQLQK